MPLLRDSSGYLSQDTITAIATEVGGAVAIVRTSGDQAFSILQEVSLSRGSGLLEPRKMVLTRLYDKKGEVLDHALVVCFQKPESYTGEDLVEYHVHGSRLICHLLLERLIELGARQALPGEFSLRGVRNGKMTLFQAQAVADLVCATNRNATALALEKMSGQENPLLSKLGTELRTLAVLGEVGIDFADQDVDEVSLPKLQSRLNSIQKLLEKLRETYFRGVRIQNGISIGFIGLPNAGKSSFFNALLGENRSIVSEMEGTTRDVVSESLTLRGQTKTVTVRLQDTAGLRATQQRIEKLGVKRTEEIIRQSDLILFLVDSSSDLSLSKKKWDELCTLSPLENKVLGVLTKADICSQEKLQITLESLKPMRIPKWIVTSSQNGEGLSEAIEAILELCDTWTHRDRGELLLTQIHQLTAVTDALMDLQRASEASEIDLFASDIRQALHSLEPLIGQTVPDDILGQIFSHFCIGK